MSEVLSFTITEEHVGARMDKALSALCGDDLSRSRLQGLIAEGQVRLNGVSCETASRRLELDDELSVAIPPPVAADPVAQDIPLDIVYEDDDVIVLNKPVGLVVHPGAGNHDGTLVNALLHHCGDTLSGIGGVMRPGIVHRLDKETTGLMVAAKNDKAHKGLAAQLEDRSLSRKYKALVLGVPMPLKGSVDAPIARHKGNRLKMSVNQKEGREARTHYLVLESYRDEFALVECALESGRTHQIRVHMDYIKHPLIGDPTYGPQPTAVQGALKRAGFSAETVQQMMDFPYQVLQAYSLSFIHPGTNEEVSFEIDMPENIRNLLNSLKI
ncbi:MAG: RluA family pseudouridine synthase [Alphaproteobacteria bacterium]|nr:RluA family pseudouridine synthase [Alphaproteobacteria bacterium]